jgi:hypothetical protein
LNGTTVAFSWALSCALTARSLVVPPITEIFLPDMSESERRPELPLAISPVDSRKMKLEKSTSLRRDSVTVLELHSMSACPFATASKRVCVVTGSHLIFNSLMLSWLSMELTTRLHKSTEKPTTSFLSSVNENGVASARYAIVMVFESAIFFNRPSRPWATAGPAATSRASASVQRRNMDAPGMKGKGAPRYRLLGAGAME